MAHAANKRAAESKLFTVKIDVQEGNFVFIPSSLLAERQTHEARPKLNRIQWTSQVGDFTIQFLGDSPFDAVVLHGSQGVPLVQRIRRDARGVYKYAVALAVAPENLEPTKARFRVMLQAGCPEIIITT